MNTFRDIIIIVFHTDFFSPNECCRVVYCICQEKRAKVGFYQKWQKGSIAPGRLDILDQAAEWYESTHYLLLIWFSC